jgi:hypothetical protein
MRAPLRGLVIGALTGATVGIAIDLLHLNISGLVFLKVALTPSITGLLLGAMVGLFLGLVVRCLPRGTGSS